MNKSSGTDTPGANFALTPAGLVNSPIKTNIFGGYSKTQVDDLLERAAELLETLLQENRRLKEQRAALEQDMLKYRELQDSLQTSLVSSQKLGETMVSAAKLQADALLEEARLAKSRAEFKVEALPHALRAEIFRLTTARERIRDDLAALLESHRTMIARIPKAESLADAYIHKTAEENSPHAMPLPEADREQLAPSSPSPPVSTGTADVYDDHEDSGYVNL